VSVLLPSVCPFVFEVELITAMTGAEFDHPFDANVHHVAKGLLRNYFVMI